MSDLLQINVLPGETRAFLWIEGRLQGLAIERDGAGARAGDRAVGRVLRLDRRVQGAFVALPEGPEGLLPLSETPGLSEGQVVAIRVKRAASEDKGPGLALDASQAAAASGAVPRWLARGAGPLEALLALDRPVECDDPALAQALKARDFATRHLPAGFPPADQAAQDEAVEQALDPVVPLPEGGSLIIESGRTLTAIDVNLGAAEPRGFNLLAAAEIARQVRLRALGGRFVVDFLAGARQVDDRGIHVTLHREFGADPARTRLVGWSRGGLYEFTRRRLGPSLPELLLEPTPYGGWRKQARTLAGEALRALERARRAAPATRLALVARPDILAAVRAHPALAWLEARGGQPVALRPGGPEPWRLEVEAA
jgi:Ribonuclease G/E